MQSGFARAATFLNLLCLDAPLVAVTWQWVFAQTFDLPVPSANRAALFLTAWLIYLVDRWVDSQGLSPAAPTSLRQRFSRQLGHGWLWIIASVAVLDAWVILRSLERQTVIVGILVGGLCLFYLGTNIAAGKVWRVMPAKEFLVGTLFALGTLVSVMPPAELARPAGLVAFLLFAGVCSLNCISIAVWEVEVDRAQGRHTIATRGSARVNYVYVGGVILNACCLIAGILWPRLALLPPAIGLAAVLLMILNAVRALFPRDVCTALADLVLLIPGFILIVFHQK